MELPQFIWSRLILAILSQTILSQVSSASVIRRQIPVSPTDLPIGWSYKGCYTDSIIRRSLQGESFANSDQNASACISFCDKLKYRLAGTEYSDECYCGNVISVPGTPADDGCSMTCSGNTSEICGGPDRLSLYSSSKMEDNTTTFTGTTGNWTTLGCYSDSVSARILPNGEDVQGGAGNMTIENCIAACEVGRYRYAGVEFAGECYCGNDLVNEHAAEAIDDCDMNCKGDSAQFCGGPDRINLYEVNVTLATVTTLSPSISPSTTTSTSSSVNVPGSNTVSSGLEVASSMVLSSGTTSSTPISASLPVDLSSEMSVTVVSSVESSNSTSVLLSSPIISGSFTTTDSSSINFQSSTASSRSELIVSSSAVSSSGSSAMATLFASSPTPNPSFSSEATFNLSSTSLAIDESGSATISSTATLTISPSTTSGNLPSDTTVSAPRVGWYYQGCYSDSTNYRTLSIGKGVTGGMTNSKCQAACQAAGYIYAGTEYSGECYCDNKIRNGGGPAYDGAAQCNMACNGNQTDTCGGPNRLTLWQYSSGITITVSSAVSTPATTSSASSSSIAVPVSTELPSNFTYKGCYVDGPGYRIMDDQQPDDDQMTIASCANKCAAAGYSIAGMEYSYQCFCDNLIRMGGYLATSDSDCNSNCAGNSSQICGGGDRLSVWSNQTNITVIQSPRPLEIVGDWEYQGCIVDGGEDQRVFPWQLINATGNSPQWCLAQCRQFGYMAAGLEFGQECYCGDLDGSANAAAAAESECNTACPGDPEKTCGSGLRLSWYKWTGEPFYIWNYPQGTAAGRYEFLVGGPVIPLITQPAVNGKVSFLEKHGTGPPNSTGVFEFDPLLNSFREMYGVQTDIFCSASLTMPDRAGRQLNIGGWSADSLFGIRIYWSDGSPGSSSVNDWIEDVDVVHLQQGRWYPTGMVMANGSILVVGGEDGSNGLPVPNMEILPTVGPIYEAQYLKDTDPYNLYPFLVVLPSGGIFIHYYNQARILDEVTLETVKIMPQAPACVNDPTGGRTYPLEGTQVLLPQYYPYSDPLEILICGGAGIEPAWGIDNCISIMPEATQPQWILERMPSRRVISCMTTLPDGTFLILNGAEVGRAGFGLAESANLNAVLYDPSQPRHQRMSIMANTTIARLYHSEAVLMDDGRVLVSGSDPEDGINAQEYRVEVFMPPYLLSGAAQPTFNLSENDWEWEGQYLFTVTSSSGTDLRISLLGAEASTHGNSMGARILFPTFSCSGNACTVQAPKGPYVAPAGWYRMFVLDGPTPSHGKWLRLGGDPGSLGNWPNATAFQPLPGLGPL